MSIDLGDPVTVTNPESGRLVFGPATGHRATVTRMWVTDAGDPVHYAIRVEPSMRPCQHYDLADYPAAWVEPLEPGPRCGRHGNPTDMGRCARCDALTVALSAILGDTAGDYENHAEQVFAAAVALVAEYVATGTDSLGGTLGAIAENLESAG